MANDRMDQVDKLVKKDVAVILQRLFPEYIVAVTQVKVSKDLSFSKIWIAGSGDTEELLKLVKREAKEIRRELAKKLVLRRIPYLQFILDNTELEADKIEKLFLEIKKGE
jgi:ribosome-binding factor A